jgi:hypothetical protein
MEYVDGVNLRQAMRAGRFTPDQALAIVPKVCEALQYAHNEGILHRDIKPENILLDSKGRVKIADFGIAKLIADVQPDVHLTGSGATLGTPHYMAPEQIERPAAVDHRADIYSLGVVFYEMLTGELPLGRFAPPSEKSAADPRLDDVVFRTLEKEPSRRPQSAGEVKTQVETISSRPASAANVAPPPRMAPAQKSWPKIVGIILLLLSIPCVVLAVFVLYWMLQVQPSEGTGRNWVVSFLVMAMGSAGVLFALIAAGIFVTRLFRRGHKGRALIAVGGVGAAAALLIAFAGIKFFQARRAVVAEHIARVAQKQAHLEREMAREAAAGQPGLASLITWSPSLRPGEKPDLNAMRREAVDLAAQGRYEEALQRRLWYHEHALEFEPSQSAVRLSFALAEWMKLAQRYPKARQALVEIRDRGVREFNAGAGSFALLMDVSAINAQLGEKDMTYFLFVSMTSRDPQLASECYHAVEDLLVEKGDYALCARFIPNFNDRLEQARELRLRTMEVIERTPEANQSLLRQEAAATFIREAKKLIEILVGVGRRPEAEKIQQQALATLRVPQLEAAIADAELKVGRFNRAVTAGAQSAPSAQLPTVDSIRALARRINEGDQTALDELGAVAGELYRGIDYQTDQGRVSTNLVLMRAAFRELGEEAGRGNTNALSALQSAAFSSQLKSHATHGIGIAAGAGNEQALDMLLHHRDWNILLSSAVFAIRPAAEKTNEQAVLFLSDVLTNNAHRALWRAASEALRAAAAKGSAQAKAAVEEYEKREGPPKRRP